ncbi:ZAR1-like protein [Latimeria chalumnae]|nr:PREDICTED: ZAR1-like protein [Latimeria chalumnae]|eukprot:XP_006005379.1 PREDICTED: ZAR1-like protein [Latimeria chalumnae]
MAYRMDGFVYSPYNLYASYGTPAFAQPPNPKYKQTNWKPKDNSYPAPETGDYLENYKRAQLKAILSQVNPNLTPRLRKANVREVGVQVNSRVDASVQCSLGPRTLSYPGNNAGAPGSPAPHTPPLAAARFSRPLDVYSPVFERRQPPFAGGHEQKENVPAAAQEQAAAPETAVKETSEEIAEKEKNAAAPEGKRSEPAKDTTSTTGPQRRFRFQFLEQKYGYFHCRDCNIRWESAYVWCISGTNKVYFKQLCRDCQNSYNPYRVEAIQCQTCSKARCICPQKKRHIDLKRPHRQELCGRCKDKRLSCDSTYSFKYIV